MYPPHDLGGGYEITWRSSVLHLRARGHEVRVLTTDYRAPGLDRGFELEEDVHRELRWYWRDHAFPRYPLRERIAIERHNESVLERHLGAFEPDVVAWWAMGGMSLTLVERVRRAGLPAVGIVGDEWLRWGPRADAWLRPLRARPRLGRAAERVTGLPATVDFGGATWLFNSAAMRDSSPRVPHSAVAHPGIDDELFQPAAPQAWRWRLLYLGRLDERKGVHLTIDALHELPDEATLTIQGSGDASYEQELRARAAAAGLRDRVVFSTARRDQLAGVYAAADVVLFPVQWEEPWGLVPLEAMACGRPVVASGTGGSREYLRDGENCILYAPRDSPAALAKAVRRIADDEPLRARLRDQGLATAAAHTERGYNESIERALEQVVRELARNV
jgi:glycosyltransferase involved in cell wall biosynthesis